MQSKEQDILHFCLILENSMQIILLETLNKLGKAGEIVSVKDGFANNFLIPQKKAIIANKKNKEQLQSKMSQIKENNDKKINEANQLKSKLEGKELNFKMEANEEGNLYGNLGPRQICDKVNKNYSVNLDPGSVIVNNINTLGTHYVTLRLYDEISASLKLEVTKNT